MSRKLPSYEAGELRILLKLCRQCSQARLLETYDFGNELRYKGFILEIRDLEWTFRFNNTTDQFTICSHYLPYGSLDATLSFPAFVISNRATGIGVLQIPSKSAMPPCENVGYWVNEVRFLKSSDELSAELRIVRGDMGWNDYTRISIPPPLKEFLFSREPQPVKIPRCAFGWQWHV